jgi:hypothetical protein
MAFGPQPLFNVFVAEIESENEKEKKRDRWDCIVLLPFSTWKVKQFI